VPREVFDLELCDSFSIDDDEEAAPIPVDFSRHLRPLRFFLIADQTGLRTVVVKMPGPPSWFH